MIEKTVVFAVPVVTTVRLARDTAFRRAMCFYLQIPDRGPLPLLPPSLLSGITRHVFVSTAKLKSKKRSVLNEKNGPSNTVVTVDNWHRRRRPDRARFVMIVFAPIVDLAARARLSPLTRGYRRRRGVVRSDEQVAWIFECVNITGLYLQNCDDFSFPAFIWTWNYDFAAVF